MPGAHTLLFTPHRPQLGVKQCRVPVVKSADTLIRALYTVNYDEQQYKINHVISSSSFIMKGIIDVIKVLSNTIVSPKSAHYTA